MHSIAILGAGDLAATLARRIAEQELARRVVLVEADETRARGKALDIAQSGPVEGFDVEIQAVGTLSAAGAFDALVVADPPELADPHVPPSRASALGESLAAAVGTRLLLVAAASGATVISTSLRNSSFLFLLSTTAPVDFPETLSRSKVIAEDVSANS